MRAIWVRWKNYQACVFRSLGGSALLHCYINTRKSRGNSTRHTYFCCVCCATTVSVQGLSAKALYLTRHRQATPSASLQNLGSTSLHNTICDHDALPRFGVKSNLHDCYLSILPSRFARDSLEPDMKDKSSNHTARTDTAGQPWSNVLRIIDFLHPVAAGITGALCQVVERP